MLPMAWWLKHHGYHEVKCPTFKLGVDTLASHGDRLANLITALSSQYNDAPVDIVTHSMGALVFRSSLQHDPAIRRAVLLAPPNQGAQAAQKVRDLVPLHRTGWDPLAELLPGVPIELPTASNLDVGILAGGRGSYRGFNPFLEGDNDGKVRVGEAPLLGMTDFRIVQAPHSIVMMMPTTFRLVLHFMNTGSFIGGQDC